MTKTRLLTAGVFVLAGISGYFYWNSHRATAPAVVAKADAKTDAKLALSRNQIRFDPHSSQLAYVQVATVVALPEPLIEPLNGRITYDENRTARISSPITGRVIKIGAQPGDAVTAGQPLVWLDAPDYSSAVADVSKSQADIRQKQAVYARAKSLHDGEVLARKDLEAAQADLSLSEAEQRRAQQRLANLTQGRGDGSDKYVVRAPLSGIVTERKVNPGAEVRPEAADALFVITDPLHLWVIIDVPEKYIGKVVVGQKIILDVDAYPNGDFTGTVASIGEVLDPATRRIPVRCTIDNPQRRLKPEMFARVTPVENQNQKRVRIPNAAIITEGLYSTVFVEKEAGLFEKRRVTLGLQGREDSYIKDGLNEGERVVVSGALLLSAEFAGRD